MEVQKRIDVSFHHIHMFVNLSTHTEFFYQREQDRLLFVTVHDKNLYDVNRLAVARETKKYLYQTISTDSFTVCSRPHIKEEWVSIKLKGNFVSMATQCAFMLN